ncbi:MAG TPA: UDP-N-acetylenolpyruvoylglucosamine reductase, partial [Pusillimonas sp.]|nr:UDP-N-acetylenolpyruvoylglucosamine reductase [Pusillimonas sp.]
GLENLALIPGTVGAAPVQNIGAYGVELDQFVHKVTAWDIEYGEQVCFERNECRFSYRDSFFKKSTPGKWLILAVQFLLPHQWQPVLGYPDLAQHEGLRA